MSDLLDHPTAIRSGEELDLAKLEPFLRRHFPNEAGALEIRQFPSGHSNLTYSLHLGAKELVLRRPPLGSKVKSAHDMSREFRVLSKLHSVYAPAPEVLLYCDDTSVIGAPFYVMQPIPGVILRRHLPSGLDFPAETARRLSESLSTISFACMAWSTQPQDFPNSVSRTDIGTTGPRMVRALLRFQDARLSGSREDFSLDAGTHANHKRRLADSQRLQI